MDTSEWVLEAKDAETLGKALRERLRDSGVSVVDMLAHFNSARAGETHGPEVNLKRGIGRGATAEMGGRSETDEARAIVTGAAKALRAAAALLRRGIHAGGTDGGAATLVAGGRQRSQI